MKDRTSGLDTANIINILPQKQPSILVDRVVEVEPDTRILVQKNTTVSEPAFSGHFPGMPILPNSVLVEAWVQTCSLLAYATERYKPITKVITLVGINKAKFHRTLAPGSTIELEAELLRKRSNVWRFACRTFEQDLLVAQAELALSIHDRDIVL